MENHTYNITTEEPRYTGDMVPPLLGPACLTRREVWYPAGEWKNYKKPWVKVPAESLEALYLDHFQNASDAVAYDFIVAKHAYPLAYPEYGQPTYLPRLYSWKRDGDFTKKDSGAAYAWEDRGNWDDEERMIVPPVEAELPPWCLRVPEVSYRKWYRIIEPRFSQSVLRALLVEYANLESIEAGYDCAVAAEALGVEGEDLPGGLWYEEKLTTSSGNLTVRKPEQGGIRAIPYNEKECGMSEECLIALEQHFLDLEQDDCDYWREICESEVDTKLPKDQHRYRWEDFSDLVSNAFGPCKEERYNPDEEVYEGRFNMEGAFGIKDLTRFRHVNLLKLPINAQAATYYDLEFNNPKAIVAKFERVDISTIPAEKMTCMCCLDDFEEAEDNESGDDESDEDKSDNYWVPYQDYAYEYAFNGFPVPYQAIDWDELYDDDSDDDDSEDDEAEFFGPPVLIRYQPIDLADDEAENDEAKPHEIKLSNGKVRFNNSPVKMPCPHGHLIGKTCLLQLLDAEMRTCPMCRFVIYTPKPDPRRDDHPGLPVGVNADQVIEQYSVWD